MTELTFNNFNEVQHPPLKVFNRTVTALNINADYGMVELEKYLNQFNEWERLQISYMTKYMKQNGAEQTKATVLKGFVPEDEE